MGSCGTRPENESTTDCRAVRMLLDCTRYASRVGKAEMLLAVWSTAALLNQRFQRFRIDSDQIVLPWRTISNQYRCLTSGLPPIHQRFGRFTLPMCVCF